jgi:hypothetical protein
VTVNWIEVITRACENFVAVFPLILIFFIPFRDNFAFSVKRVVFESFFACVAFAASYGFLFVAFGFDEFGVVNSLVCAWLFYFRGFWVVKHIGVSKRLFMLGLAIHASALASALAVCLVNIPFYANISEGFWFMPFMPVRIIVYISIGWVVHRWLTPLLKQIKAKDMRGMWLIPIMFIIMFHYFMATDYYILTTEHNTDMSSPVYLFAFLILAPLSFAVYLFLFHMLDNIANKARLETEVLAISNQLELQREHYTLLQMNVEEAKRARHDLRYHLSVFESYIDTGENEKLTDYINEYKNSLPDDTELAFCENYAVNSILRYYIVMARSEGIRVDAHIALHENAGVNDSDLCIVFGNCVENAVEACRRTGGDRFIKINSKTTGKLLTVTIDNSFDGTVIKDGPVFLSRKREGGTKQSRQGFGISSVAAVAKKYNGDALFETKGSVFQASVILRIK